MRLANLGGRAAIVWGHSYVDVHFASAGRFGHDPQALFEEWNAFRALLPGHIKLSAGARA